MPVGPLGFWSTTTTKWGEEGGSPVSIQGQSQNDGDHDDDVLASCGLSHPNKQALVNISIVIFSYFV